LSEYSNDRGENDAKFDGLWRVGKRCRSEIQSFTFAGKTGFLPFDREHLFVLTGVE
jgi:hypothetical protein